VGTDHGRDAVSGAEFVVVAVAVAIAVWWLDVQRHPIRRCPSCGGSRKNTSNSSRWGVCGRCGGKGAVRRIGAKKTTTISSHKE
jgi:hypothetical protein